MTNLATTEYRKTKSQPLTEQQQQQLLLQLPQWQLVTQSTAVKLQRDFKFADYQSALALLNQIAQLAERYQHHPEMFLTWGKLTVSWWTHQPVSLQLNDFICAAQTEQLYCSRDKT